MADLGMHPAPVSDLFSSFQPQYSRPRGAACHSRVKRPCFTLKRPKHCTSPCRQRTPGTVFAAIGIASQQGTRSLTVEDSPRNAELQRQLEASYLAQSADEVDVRHPPATTSDSEPLSAEDYAQLERSWQTYQASTSGRSNVADSPVVLPGGKSARRQNRRSTQRLNRLYTASTHQSSEDQQPVRQQCPDAQFCATLRQQLETEKAKRRISRYAHGFVGIPGLAVLLQLHSCSDVPLLSLIHCQ